ncbi:T9SS type A sorting domain-containing protein [Pontimicrobium sp. SW4]|uniref:T9SS type A sorting domain-containing protein n=1 Tax=Pontimicrobium sp. SW4 TaxID=3153519 RepID=A0AAU7BNL1_9FLAO
MKQQYILLILSMFTSICMAQTYEFALVHNGNYDFKVVAIPNFDSGGNTDISDIGFTLMLPAGTADIVNHNGLLTSRTWTVQQHDAAFLTGQGLGDGTLDAFQFNVPPGQSIITHTNGQQIDLISFQVSNNPTSGTMYFLLNSDPIATGAGSVLDSFYNTDLDGPGGNPTADYFGGLASGMESFSFAPLSIDNAKIDLAFISVYPNPTKGVVNVDTSKTISKLELYDVLGKLVVTKTNSYRIDLTQLPNGIYFLKGEVDNTSFTRRIVKQ